MADRKAHGEALDEATLQKYREAFKQKMEQYESDFFSSYTKPEGSVTQQINNQYVKTEELKKIVKTNREALQAQSRVYSDKEINIDQIPGENVLFNPELHGLAKIYTLLGSEAIEDLEKRATVMNDAEQGIFGEGSRNFVKELDGLLEASKKQVSATQIVLDLANESAFNLIVTIAEFFDTGLNGSALSIFNDLSDISTNNVNLQSAIIYAHSNNSHKKNLRFLTKFVYVMLVNLQCANLIRTLSKNNIFVRDNYFGDAPIRDPVVAELVASKVEQIECFEIVGKFDERKSRPYTQPVSGNKFATRVALTVDYYLSSTRTWLLEGEDITEKHVPILATILKLFAATFLMQDTGELAPMSALWDLFESIASLDVKTASFQKFQKILKMKEVTKDFNDGNKAWEAIVQIFNQQILPDVVLWGASVVKFKGIKNPVYFRDPAICKKISDGFNPFRYPNMNIQYEDIKSKVKD